MTAQNGDFGDQQVCKNGSQSRRVIRLLQHRKVSVTVGMLSLL